MGVAKTKDLDEISTFMRLESVIRQETGCPFPPRILKSELLRLNISAIQSQRRRFRGCFLPRSEEFRNDFAGLVPSEDSSPDEWRQRVPERRLLWHPPVVDVVLKIVGEIRNSTFFHLLEFTSTSSDKYSISLISDTRSHNKAGNMIVLDTGRPIS